MDTRRRGQEETEKKLQKGNRTTDTPGTFRIQRARSEQTHHSLEKEKTENQIGMRNHRPKEKGRVGKDQTIHRRNEEKG